MAVLKVGKRKYLSLREAAAMLNVHVNTLSRAYRLGRLKGERIGDYRIVFVDEKEAWRWYRENYNQTRAQAVRKRWEREKHEKESKRKKR